MRTPQYLLEADLRCQYWEPDRRECRRRRFKVSSFGYLTANPNLSPEEVWLFDISETGIAFLSGWPISKGTPLTIKLDTQDGSRLQLAAKVIHSTRCNDTRAWRIGCQFANRLSEEDLDRLVNVGE